MKQLLVHKWSLDWLEYTYLDVATNSYYLKHSDPRLSIYLCV